MIKPRVDKLMERTDSHYTAVVVAAKRARQLNSYYRALGEGTYEEYTPPMVEIDSDNYLTIALEELAAGKINYEYRPSPPRRTQEEHVARILIGVSGGIAAYKAVELARLAIAGRSRGAGRDDRGASRFVGPATFEGITGAPAHRRVQARPDAGRLPGRRHPGHDRSPTSLVANADAFVVAPGLRQHDRQARRGNP